MTRLPYESFRRQLAGACHLSEIPEAVWRILLEDGYVERVVRGVEHFALLQRKAAPLLKLAGLDCHEAGSMLTIPPEEREEAFDVLNEMFGTRANRDPEVQAFREHVLGGRLLEWGAVETWIEQAREAEADLPPWLQLTLTVPGRYVRDVYEVRRPPRSGTASSGHRRPVEGPALQFPPISFERVVEDAEACFLRYAVPDDDGIPRLSVAAIPKGGILERLYLISIRLAEQYGWEPAFAVVLVLTGETPPIGMISHQLRYPPSGRGTIIVLTIQPDTTSAEVAAYYRRLRQVLFGINPKQRGMGEKSLRLAAFIERRPPLSKTETWAIRMADWNEQIRPEWHYTRPSNLQRDYQRARKWLSRSNPIQDSGAP